MVGLQRPLQDPREPLPHSLQLYLRHLRAMGRQRRAELLPPCRAHYGWLYRRHHPSEYQPRTQSIISNRLLITSFY